MKLARKFLPNRHKNSVASVPSKQDSSVIDNPCTSLTCIRQSAEGEQASQGNSETTPTETPGRDVVPRAPDPEEKADRLHIVIIPGFIDQATSKEVEWDRDLAWLSAALGISQDLFDVLLLRKDYLSGTGAETIDTASADLMRYFDFAAGKKKGPIVFICHSLGGIIAKKFFGDAQRKFPEQVVRIRGILFFGTPHKIVPADAENSPVAKIAQLNDRDIETIDVAALSQVCETFIIESAKALETKFVSFHETKPTAPSNNIIIDQARAIMGSILPRALALDHRDMSAFKGEVPVTRKEIRAAVRSIMGETFDFLEKDNDIAAVKDTIETSTMIRPWDGARSQQIAASNYSEGVNITNNMTTMNETHYHYEGNRLSTVPGMLSQEQQDSVKQILAKAGASAEAREIKSPVQGTLQWLNKDEKYAAWNESTSSEFLVVIGEAGTGKSVLSSHIRRQLEQKYQPHDTLVLYYFIDESTENQSKAESTQNQAGSAQDGVQSTQNKPGSAALLLRALMFQITVLKSEALSRVPTSYLRKFHTTNLDDLTEAFTCLLSNTQVRRVHILVDALDECEDNSQREIIKQLAVVSLFQEDIPVRVYISCRPTTTAAKFLNKPDFDSPQVKLLEIMQAQLRHDITIYVNSWIDKFIAAGVVNRENAQTLAVMLTDKAEGTFIWLAAAAEVLLQDSTGVGFGKLKENVQKLPANLRSLYISRLNKFKPEHKVVFGNVFRVLRASYGKRTWEEINLLVTIRPEHRSVAGIREKSEFEDAVAFAIRTRNLVNSHEGRVSFLHSTLKDALEDFPHLEMDRGMRPFQSDERDCHHFLAERCMRFLIMPDIKRDISMLLGIQDESSESSHGDDDHSDLSDSGEDKTFTTDEGGLWLFNDESPNEEATLHGPLKVLFDDMTQEFKILPLFAYAATSWWKHFRACLTDDDQTLRDVAWSLLQSPNEQHWYQYLQAESKSTRNSGAGSGPEFPDNPAPLTLAYCLGFTSIVENRSEKVTSAGLRWATRNGHLDCVMVWLDKAGSDLEWNNDRDLSRSLFEAADRGHTDIFKALLQVGSSAINDRHERGMTPLAVAIAGDHSSIVTSILGLANAELNASDSHQMTPIFLANTKDIFSQLRTDPRTNIKHLDKERRNVLLHACASGKLTIVKLLIKEGTFDINSQDKKGKTPLMCAVCAGHLEIVRFLLRQGNVDVNKLDVDDRNAISWAAGISNPKILKCLCDKDPSGVNVQDRDGYYPLDWTLYPSVNEHNARLLLKLSNGQFRKEAGLRTFNHTFGYSALSIAVMLISENWLDVNAVSDEGRTALSYACEKGPKSLISLILMVPELNPNLIGNTTEHLEEILVKREGSRKHLDSSEIVPEIRKLIHERRRA